MMVCSDAFWIFLCVKNKLMGNIHKLINWSRPEWTSFSARFMDVVVAAVKLHKIKEMKFKVMDQFQWKQLFDR